jgi:peptidoglycan/xylan/chitin deacetylase (PgdA/CDA1 family)
MTARAYLTIDDTPSETTDTLTDALKSRNIPAVFFCRGDRLEANPAPAIRAIAKGFCAANHAYSHTRASLLSFEDMSAEIARTEKLLEDCYDKAGVARGAKYFRFPHMDRGAGGWVVDYDAVPPAWRETVTRLFADGLNISLEKPDPALVAKKHQLQDWLRAAGYAPFAAGAITHKWFSGSELGEAIDAMYTFSTSDWMLLPRHQGKWPYKTLDDLKKKIDDDAWLNAPDSINIVLAHDNAEILDVTLSLIDHMRSKNIEFKDIKS